ncbi:RHS repeat-associated core domain-containing protein [Streptomyces capparidis]
MNGKTKARARARLRRGLAVAVPVALAATLLQDPGAPAVADTRTREADTVAVEKPVPGHPVKVRPRAVDPAPRTPVRPPRAAWPRAGTATVGLSPNARTVSGDWSTAADIPVTVTVPPPGRAAGSAPPARAEVRLLDRAASDRAGVDGPLFGITPHRGTTERGGTPVRATVTVDYSGFAEAFGGSYASRLRLLELPACAATTPAGPECRRAIPLTTDNDTETQSLTTRAATLRPGATTLLAVAAAPSSENGDYKATSLSPSATWSTNLNTGDFSWSYDMDVPDVPGGLAPKVTLGYSSGAVDGRTGGTNNQSSWAGDGFDLWPGYIERRYKPCADDDVTNADGNKPGDLCWGYDNAVISFNGKAGELVPAGENRWKLRQDDGTRIVRLADSARGNGDNNNEYWKVTTPDGTEYHFGYHKPTGWATGKETTDSTWTVPVFGDDAGDECHTAAFADSWCQQAWRWNLDYVVDPHGNAVVYYYDKEANSYGRNLQAKDDTPYTRGGHLDRIEYGLKSTDVYAGKALAKVDFDSVERCLPETGVTCAPDTIDAKAYYWYDTPWDLNCTAGTDCDKGRLSPTFWTRKRLTGATTQTLKSDGTYAPVDSWKLGHRWGTSDVDRQLILTSVQRTGHTATPTVTLPKVTLGYAQRANRLDRTGDGKAPFIKERLATVSDESGGQLDIEYSAPACAWDSLPTPQTNTTRCFPQFIDGDSTSGPVQHWFNKYVVDVVKATDRTGGSPTQHTRYDYLDGAAWHFDDDDGMTKEKFKTWSTWRGYGHVRVRTGSSTELKTQTDHYFLRGMHGDRKGPKKEDGTKDVQVTLRAGEGDPLTDHESAAGFTYRVEQYDRPGGTILGKTIDRPWHHETAKRTRDWGTITANLMGTADRLSFTSLDGGAGEKWRTTRTHTTFDTVAGRALTVDDRGGTGTTADDLCTRTTYADNTTKNILDAPARVETVATSCDDTSVDRAEQVVSDVRTAYDNGAYGAAPTKGDPTAVATLKKHTGTEATYLETGSTFDAYGRALTATDITAAVVFDLAGKQLSRTPRTDARTTTTAYSPAAGLPTQVTVTSPKATATAAPQTTTTTLDTRRGLPLTTVDTNSKRTEFGYDALGRTTKVWLPDRRSALPASFQYAYTVTEGKIVSVATKYLGKDGNYLTSHALYDGFLRSRQTQAPGPDGGRLLADTFYDARGLVAKTFATYYGLNVTPGELFGVDAESMVESRSEHTYDGLGRETLSRQVTGEGEGHQVLATTRTIHGGDRVTAIPPVGGTATTTETDARGRTTKLHQHHTRAADAPADTTRYEYTPAGQLAKLTDPVGNTWTWTYDQLGRQELAEDPDKGPTKTVHDDRGLLVSSEDAEGNVLHHTYDGLGRKTETRSGGATGPLLASWTYDTVSGAVGQLASSTRHVGDTRYVTRVDEYDSLYRATLGTVVVPQEEGALAGSYQTRTGYHSYGAVSGISLPKAGSLPGGGVVYGYDDILRPVTITGIPGAKVAVDSYSLTGKPLLTSFTNTTTGAFAQVKNEYERGTQRLRLTRVDRLDIAGVDKHATYTYDEIGNVRAVSDVSRSGTETQCFTYDHLRRTTEEWTQPTETCAATPTGAAVGGLAPYWHSYTYDKTGNRVTETRHDPSGDTLRTYTYPPAGAPQPHTLTSVTTEGPTGEAVDTYTYFKNGNTKTRTRGGDTQTLTWNPEGHLASVTEPTEDGGTKTTSYLYDAAGNRLIGRTDTETTLYLGSTEITLAKGSTTPKATRYIDAGGGNVLVQKDDGTVTFTLGDHHGTGELAISAADLSLQQRRTTPFGAPRGPQPATWPGTRGFVGGTTDTTTGLTHLGAREYDPTTGRFISVDPLLEPNRPQTLNGYTYANNSPATFSDPTGEAYPECMGGGWICRNGTEPVQKDKNYDHIVQRDREASAAYRGITQRIERNGAALAEFERCHPLCSPEVRERVKQMGVERYPTITPPTTGETIFDGLAELTGLGPAHDCYDERARCGEAALAVVPWKLGKAGQLVKRPASRALGKAKSWLGIGRKSCDSFLPDAQVLMADGTRKKIGDIKVGDKVLATDPETGRTKPREVVATIITEDDKQFADITVRKNGRTSSIVATTHHPFWTETTDTWLDAGDLEPGMLLRTPDGTTAEVQDVRLHTETQSTRNLTVEELHTYYVLAGATPVLVHNSNCAPGTLPGTRFDVPEQPGIYTIHLNDGTKYVGSSTSSIRERVNKSMRSKHAVRKAGYTADDVVNVTYFTLPSGTSKTAIRRMEQTMMEGVKARGGTLLNRRDPEIEVPFGGYLP